MFLGIDIGNSDTVFSIHNGLKWLFQFRIESNTAHSASDFDARFRLYFLENNLEISKLSLPVEEMCKNLFGRSPIVVGPTLYPKLPLTILRPNEIGTDLVCNALYGHLNYKKNIIIIDFGTALTFTIVSKTGEILGVTIAPGLKTAVRSLFTNTAQLPEVPLEVPQSVIGQNTVHAIQAGVMWGYIGMVEKMIQKIKAEISGECKVIATGGLCQKLTELHPLFDEVDINITLNGLKLIANYQD
jgi:type III pantothenate kinase